MDSKRNGINMVGVKKKNRSSILNLIYHSDGISRKDIAAKLHLTPAAITLITTDLINEGLILENPVPNNNRKGRKEINLSINVTKFATIGVYISENRFRAICIDLAKNILFEDTIITTDCHNNAKEILDKIVTTLEYRLALHEVNEKIILLGIGISVKGIVDTQAGISIKSYDVWEDNVPVVDYIQGKINLPIILTNNICALAHGESFFSSSENPDNLLFIKYGPGVGAARVDYQGNLTINDFNAIQVGHTIADPKGRMCMCGKQGCLETIASYDAIIKNASEILSKRLTPTLYGLVEANPNKINMYLIMKAYAAGDCGIINIIERVIFYLCITVVNAICLFDPETIVLYGEIFENVSFKNELQEFLKKHTSEYDRIFISEFSQQLDVLGPASTVISFFFDDGGFVPNEFDD